MKVAETNVTGPLISRRLILLIYKNDIKMKKLRKYDSTRAQMLRVKRVTIHEIGEASRSEVAPVN